MKKATTLFILFLSFLFATTTPVVADTHGETVLVFGGTGRLGSEIVKHLVAQNHQVTVFARPSSNRERVTNLPVSFVVGDVLNANDVDTAVTQKNFSVVIDALGRGSANSDFYRISAENIANAVTGSSVKQIILHGSVGADTSRKIMGSLSESMERLMQAKTAGERAVKQSGTNFTIIRNYIIRRHGTPATQKAILMQDETAFGPITRADLAILTGDCIANPKCFNQVHALDPSLMRNPPDLE